MKIECKNNKTNLLVELGTLTNKALIGKSRDPLLTFSKNGVETFHLLDNTINKYKQY